MGCNDAWRETGVEIEVLCRMELSIRTLLPRLPWILSPQTGIRQFVAHTRTHSIPTGFTFIRKKHNMIMETTMRFSQSMNLPFFCFHVSCFHATGVNHKLEKVWREFSNIVSVPLLFLLWPFLIDRPLLFTFRYFVIFLLPWPSTFDQGNRLLFFGWPEKEEDLTATLNLDPFTSLRLTYLFGFLNYHFQQYKHSFHRDYIFRCNHVLKT